MFSFTDTILILTTLGCLFLAYFKWSLSHWSRRNIPHLNPRIPWGDLENPFGLKTGINFKIRDIYKEFKSKGHKIGGFYFVTKPMLLLIDPEYIKNVMARDFQYFMNRGIYYNEKVDPLSAHLVNIEDQEWKRIRAKLTPTFTSGKMKLMFETLLDCGNQLTEEVDKMQSNKKAIDVKELVACFTTDIIGSCAFGLDCNSFKDPDADFRKYGRKVFEMSLERQLKLFLGISVPTFCKFIGMTTMPKDVRVFFMDVFKKMLAYRENSSVVRNDFLQLLLDLKNSKPEHPDEPPLTVKQMAAQSFIFFLAGFETSSTTLTFCFYELAKNQIIQNKVRNEIQCVLKKYDEKVTYDGIMEMKYLEQVIEETLRKYPPVPTLPRICNKNYKMPGTNVVVEKGTKTIISILGLHRDPDYYPDPEKFDPERFTEDKKAERHQFTYLPFGGGPRNCIGLRFGLMQTKIGIAVLLKNYKFTLNKKTPEHITLDPRVELLSIVEDVFLNVEKIHK